MVDLSSENLINLQLLVYCPKMKRMNETTAVQNEQELQSDVRATVRRQLSERGVQFERTDAWDRIEEHIGTHKYLLDLRSGATVDWRHAAYSWKQSVMNPLLEALERQQVVHAFPEQSMGDLYIEVSDHWYYLKQERPSASPDDAVVSFTRRFGSRVGAWFSRVLLRRAVTGLRRSWQTGATIDRNVDRVKSDISADVTEYGSGF